MMRDIPASWLNLAFNSSGEPMSVSTGAATALEESVFVEAVGALQHALKSGARSTRQMRAIMSRRCGIVSSLASEFLPVLSRSTLPLPAALVDICGRHRNRRRSNLGQAAATRRHSWYSDRRIDR